MKILSLGLILLFTVMTVFCSDSGEVYEVDGIYDFTLSDIDGNPVKFSDFRGKGVMLNVWATWCGPCKNEIPTFVALYEEYKEKGVEFIGVSTDIQGRDVVIPYMDEVGINYTMLLASESELKRIFKYIRGYPTTFFFDANGKLIERIQGEPFVDEEKGESLELFFRAKWDKILP